MATVLLRRGASVHANGAIADFEPGLVTTPAAPKLVVGLGGQTVVLADPAYVAALEARIAALEQVVRELQFVSWPSKLLTAPPIP